MPISFMTLLIKRLQQCLCLVTLTAILSACQTTADLAMQAYERQDYVTSVIHYAQYAQQRGDNMTEKKRLTFQSVVNHSVSHHETLLAEASRTDYPSRIIQLTALKTMRANLYAPIHQQLLPELMQRLSVAALTESLANDYYLLGKSITGSQRNDYKRRAEAYQNALKQMNPYKDSQALFSSNDKTYKGLLAEDLYQEGLALAKAKDHKAAASRLGRIAAIYAPYGDYKNTLALLKQYETIWRTAEYKTLMQQADTAVAKINSKRAARDVAAIYQSAVTVLSSYGDSKRAEQQASKYRQQGLVRVYVDDDSKPLMYTNAASQANYALSHAVLQPFMRLTKDRKEADVEVKIRLKERYERDGDAVDRSPQTLQIRDGNKTTTHADGSTTTEPNYLTKRFTKVTVSAENRYMVTIETTMSGLYEKKISDTVTATSEKKIVSHEGDVPSGKAYDEQQVRSMKSKDDLAKEARTKAGKELYNSLYKTAFNFKNL